MLEVKASILLGDQEIPCVARVSSTRKDTLVGELGCPIEDSTVAELWGHHDFACVNAVISDVIELETLLRDRPFYVCVGGKQHHACDVALQIDPASGHFSFYLGGAA